MCGFSIVNAKSVYRVPLVKMSAHEMKPMGSAKVDEVGGVANGQRGVDTKSSRTGVRVRRTLHRRRFDKPLTCATESVLVYPDVLLHPVLHEFMGGHHHVRRFPSTALPVTKHRVATLVWHFSTVVHGLSFGVSLLLSRAFCAKLHRYRSLHLCSLLRVPNTTGHGTSLRLNTADSLPG